MSSRKLEDLYKPLQVVAEKALQIAKEKELPITITCTRRSSDEQRALYMQGREPLEKVNIVRKRLGLYLLSEEENSRKVTWVTSSYHTCSPKAMAFDFAVGASGKIFWDIKVDVNHDNIPDYKEFAEICKSLDPNIEWGGDWENTKDFPHIQWKNGIKISQV